MRTGTVSKYHALWTPAATIRIEMVCFSKVNTINRYRIGLLSNGIHVVFLRLSEVTSEVSYDCRILSSVASLFSVMQGLDKYPTSCGAEVA